MPQDLSASPGRCGPTGCPSARARPDDLEATWRFRSAPGVGEWLTQAHDDREEYEQRFRDPERMALILVVEQEGEIVGDQMLVIEDAWAQAEVADRATGRAGRDRLDHRLPRTPVGATPPRRPPRCSGSASTDLGLRRVDGRHFADNIALLAADGADSACAARSTPSATRSTAPAAGWTPSRTRSSPTSGGRASPGCGRGPTPTRPRETWTSHT